MNENQVDIVVSVDAETASKIKRNGRGLGLMEDEYLLYCAAKETDRARRSVDQFLGHPPEAEPADDAYRMSLRLFSNSLRHILDNVERLQIFVYSQGPENFRNICGEIREGVETLIDTIELFQKGGR